MAFDAKFVHLSLFCLFFVHPLVAVPQGEVISNEVREDPKCWPPDVKYADPQPKCDERCQCTFTAPEGRVFSPCYSGLDPKKAEKVHQIDVNGTDFLTITLNPQNYVGEAWSQKSKNAINLGQGFYKLGQDDGSTFQFMFGTENFMKSSDNIWNPIFDHSAWIRYVCKDEVGKNGFLDYKSYKKQTVSEIIDQEGPILVEPPLKSDGGDYEEAMTKTWKLSGRPGKKWQIKVLRYDVDSTRDLLVVGAPSTSPGEESTRIDDTLVGKSFLVHDSTGFITFHSILHAGPRQGFALEVKQVSSLDGDLLREPSPGPSCNLNGCNYTALSGVIDLTNPILGPRNLTFRISGEKDSMVMIRFTKTKQGSDPNSILEPGDKVSIGYGGPESDSPSKESLRSWFETFSHLIHVESDLVQIPVPYDNAWISITEKGEVPEFEIAYQIIPAIRVEEVVDEVGPVVLLPPWDPSQNSSDVLNYASNSRWLWRLVAPENSTSSVRWKIKVKNFHLDEDSRDFVEFGRGERPHNNNEDVILKAYGIMEDREIIIEGPNAYIYFESNLHVKPMPGFDMSARRIDVSETNDIGESEGPEGSLQQSGGKAVKCWPDNNPPAQPDNTTCDNLCQCTYTAEASIVYTPFFSDSNPRRKMQNIAVPDADFVMLFMSNETFFVDKKADGTPNERSRNTAHFGEGNIEAFSDPMPIGTLQQFVALTDYGPTGVIRVPVLNNTAFGNYFYLGDGGFPGNNRAYYEYKSYKMTQKIETIDAPGVHEITPTMNAEGDDYEFAVEQIWELRGRPGQTWEVAVDYVDFDSSMDTLAIGPGSAPPAASNTHVPNIFLPGQAAKDKPSMFTVDSPTAYIVFRSTLHASPRRGFKLDVTRIGDIDGTTDAVAGTTPESIPDPMTPAPDVSVDRTFLMLGLEFSMEDLATNPTIGQQFLDKLVKALVETCTAYGEAENLNLSEPISEKHIDVTVKPCGSCFDKDSCARSSVRIRASNATGYYAFTSETLANMLSRAKYKDIFEKQIGGRTQLNLHCDFTWWYWALAGVAVFAAIVSTIAWRLNQKGKKVPKSHIVASSDSAFFHQDPEYPTKLPGMFEGFGDGSHEAHDNPTFIPEYDDEDDEDDATLYDKVEIPRLRPGTGFNGSDRLMEPT